ncbi:HAMP domain-containing protein [Desulfobulbus sp. US2]|nr:HAMP domain-containing protein [Desulfobulbus sp. US4]MCW5207221.1 HAMP domain-containing protein [Desulfobulbus sp. US2]
MKLKLTITICGLLLIGMLLINFVLLFLWKHDALRYKAEHDQAVLAHIQSFLIREGAAGEGETTQEFVFSDFYESSESGRFFILLEAEKQVGQDREKKTTAKVNDQIAALLTSAAVEAKSTGKQVSRTAASFSHGLFCNDLLVNARPVKKQGEVIGAISVVRSLDSLSQTLWETEKMVLVYLLINVLVLGTIGFFRMAGLVIRPVERLVALANQYSNHDPFRFVTEDSGSEFGQLSNSLNSMLVRIDEDRQTLQHTVTALEVANETLKRQQREMVHAEKLASVGRMAAGLAHEIGNPLSVVQGYLGILLGSEGQSEQHKDFLRRSGQEVQRIDKLIRQLLDFSRTAKGSPKVFSLHELLHSVVEMVKVQTVFRGIIIDADFAAEEDGVYADCEQLRQVFVNCLLNSADAIYMAEQDGLDAVHKEGGRVSVTTALQCLLPNDQDQGQEKKGNPQLLIRIRDNGIGIIEEHLPVVFDPFYTSKEPGKGTGLGLSVSRSLVETAGGTMALQSGIGQGSSMLIILPITPFNDRDEHGC